MASSQSYNHRWWGPAPEACGRCAAQNRKCEVPKNDPNKVACRQCGAGKNKCDLVPGDGRPVNKPREGPNDKGRVERLEADVRNALQSLAMERRFNGWLAAEMVRREPESQWPRVYLQSINWTLEGVPYEDGKEGEEEDDEKEDDRKRPEGSSSSESSRDSRVESWRNEVVPEAPEGEHLVEGQPEGEYPVDDQPDNQMQVDDAPVDGETGGGEMQVDPPASGSSERPEGIKIEVRSDEQMLIDLGRQLACNWLHEQKVAKRQREEEEDTEEHRKLTEKQEALEKEEAKLRRRADRRKKEANWAPSVKKETEEGEIPLPPPARPVVCVREVNNVVEILDSDDEEVPEKKPEGLEDSEGSESSESV
ncbi:hypothetical protein C8R45DRAFT_1114625 [Mycena sanguinolenta]|nr:hypothetical protein C8R45DRAFT_1114625 [Mycena sanguinolenta]